MEIGKIVKSKQGRDKGKVYVVYEIVDNDFVKLVNGDTRKIDNPKKKRVKHLDVVDESPNFDKQTFKDSDIKKLCKTYFCGGKNA